MYFVYFLYWLSKIKVQTKNLNVQNICGINYTMHIGLFHLNKNHLNLKVQVCI